MARSKRANALSEPEPPAVHAPVPAGSVRTVQTTRREFSEQIGQGGQLELEAEEPTEADDLELFLSQIDSDQGYLLRVERLPNFSTDGKTGIRADRLFVCQIPFDRSTAVDYESQIQSSYGGGDYQFQLKQGIRIVKSWRCHIARPVVRAGDPQPQPVHPNGGVQPVAPIDPLAAFKQQMAFTKEFIALSKELNPAPVPGQAAAVDPTVAEMNGKLAIIEKLIAQPNNPLSTQIISKLLGTDDSSSSWAGVVEGLIELAAPAVPIIGQIIMARMTGVNPFAPSPAAQQLGPGTSVEQAPDANPAGPVPISGQPAGSQQAGTAAPIPSESQRAVQRILGRCISDCANGFDSAGLIDDLLNVENDQAVAADPMAVATLQALINQPPAFIASRLPPMNNERGLAWLTQFQLDWRAKTEPVPPGGEGSSSDDEPLSDASEQGV